jgi:hypothetical protein
MPLPGDKNAGHSRLLQSSLCNKTDWLIYILCAAQQEVDHRLDMAFAALKFLSEKYGHILEQQNDVVSFSDWVEILQSGVRPPPAAPPPRRRR